MASNEGWAWKRPGNAPMVLWFVAVSAMVIGSLEQGEPPAESASVMSRVFGPGCWVRVRVVEVVDGK